MLREFAIMEEECFSNTVDTEKAMTRSDARSGAQGLELGQGDDRVRRVRVDSDAVATKIRNEHIRVGRINNNLV